MKLTALFLALAAICGGCADVKGQDFALHGRYIFRSQGFLTATGISFSEAGEISFNEDGTYLLVSTYNVGGRLSTGQFTRQRGNYKFNGPNSGSAWQNCPILELPINCGDTWDFYVSGDRTLLYGASTDAGSTWVMECHRAE